VREGEDSNAARLKSSPDIRAVRKTAGWSFRDCPTPGRCLTRGMLNLDRWSLGPIPDSIRSLGVLKAPAVRIISCVANAI